MEDDGIMYLAGLAAGILVGAWLGWWGFAAWGVAAVVLWLLDR